MLLATVTGEMTREELARHEQVIERGKQTYVEVGLALWEIREGRGYRFEYGTFEDYCQERWGWTRDSAYKHIVAAQVVTENVETFIQKPSYGQAIELARLTPTELVGLVQQVDLDKTSVRQLAQIVKAKKVEAIKEARAERIAEIVGLNQSNNVPLSGEVGTFNVIYADPPWQYDYSPTEARAIENQYPTMPLADICELPVSEIAAEDCVLFLWTTSPKLEDALTVLRAWGFTYKTNMVWVKDKIGMGYYARQQHELLLIATKGALPVPEPATRPASVICGERAAHSAKPESVYGLLERMYPDFPKVELFCRAPREGWSVWGNQSR